MIFSALLFGRVVVVWSEFCDGSDSELSDGWRGNPVVGQR